MTTRSWSAAGVIASGARPPVSRRGWQVGLCLLLLALAPAVAPAQTLGNFCPIGTCDITDPHYVNVYWDTSLAQWDIDVAANTAQMKHDHIDHITESLIHSEYFVNTTMFGDGALNQYSVTGATLGSSLATGACPAAPGTLDKAHDAVQNLVLCFLANNPSLKAPNLILNLFVPPQSMQAPGYCMGDNAEAGDHNQYMSSLNFLDPPVQVSFLPTTGACHGDLAGLFVTVTHEMVEATTDPNYKSPTGWKDGVPGDFYGQEAGDLCEKTKTASVPFLFGSASTYWSDLAAKCSSGFPLGLPEVNKATACGAGQNMTITLSGSFGPTPWDLASNKFGKQTLYLNARITHGGKVWGAGNFEGLPSDSVNQGNPDVVHFGPSGVNWSQNTITISGFDNNYGKTMANGAVAEVVPGDQIALKLARQDSGQFLTSNVTASSASQILNLAVTPTGGDPYIFVNRQADVTGTVADSGKCGIQSQLVELIGYQGSVNPGSAGTSATGQFQSTYFASTVAGTQQVRATLYNNSAVKASAPVPVHPILNSITPNVGPVAGGQSATLAGDGFDPGNTTVAFSGAGAQVNNVALQSLQVVTPKSPLGGDGDGTADVIATVNGLDSLSVPYKYVVPGKPYISFKSVSCKDHYIVVTVYDANAQPVQVPIHLSAGYQAYSLNGVQWLPALDTTSGVWVQVDKGGPFTATNTNNNLSSTASFPVLPGPICYNVRLITKVDWHIFEKTNVLDPVEVSQLSPGGRPGTSGKKVVIWTSKGREVKQATSYVLDPAGSAGGGLRVSSVGAEQFRGILHARIFLTGGLKTESATGPEAGNVREVQFVGPAFSIVRSGQRGDEVGPLGHRLILSFDLSRGNSNPHTFHIVHLTKLDGQPAWVEDGTAQFLAYKSAITRTVDQGGIYALLEEMGSTTETVQQPPQQRKQEPQQQQPAPQRHQAPAGPQPAPQGSTVLVPDNAFPGGVLTGVVLGPDDKPVPNTPVTIAGGVPVTLTGVVIGEEQPQQPQTPQQPQQPCQPDPATGLLPPGCAPPTVSKPTDCGSILRRFAGTAGGVTPSSQPQPGAAPAAGAQLLTDANGRFGMCVPVDAPKVGVGLPGGTPTTVTAAPSPRALPLRPPSFFQPRQKISITGVLRDLKADQGGRTWLLPAVNAWSPSGDQVITAFETPRDLNPGPIRLSYTGGDGQTHQVQGNVFRIVRATLDRSQLHSHQGATFQYVVQFGAQPGENLCVEMHVGGPVVLVQAPAGVLTPDAAGMATFSGRIRATQVAPGAAVPFELTPNIVYCAGSAPRSVLPPSSQQVPPVVATLQANPDKIAAGQSSTLIWSTQGADDVSLEGQKVNVSGSQVEWPSQTTTYHLVAKGQGGTQEATATVAVFPAPTDQQLFDQSAQDIYFDSDKDDLRPQSEQVLAHLAQTIKAHPNWKVQIEGNCDSVEGEGTTEYALALGERRSSAAFQYLLLNGVSADALRTISYGKEKPVCTDTSEDCLQKNRRDHFTLLP